MYPGDLAAEVFAPRRTFRQLFWLAPLAAAAVVAVVLWTRTDSPQFTPSLPSNVEVATTTDAEDSLFVVNEVPHMQTDLGISPEELTSDDSVPSFSEVSPPDMPSMPSFDFSVSDSST